MSNNSPRKPIATAIGVALAGALSTGIASAAENPFGLSEIGSGYMQLAGMEGKCGEGKCGGNKAATEGQCGGAKAAAEGKCGEGKCGGNKAATEGQCGGAKAAAEGKCGEGKCGGNK